MTRRMLIAGNWKMHGFVGDDGGPGDIGELAKIDRVAHAAHLDIAICVPATLISQAHTLAPHIWIGGQDCHRAESGPYTGWLAAWMLRHQGASMVIVGHSERRAGACETDAQVSAKAEAALTDGLLPIVCVGENEAERDAGDHLARVMAQLDGSLPRELDNRTIVAYEPVWAIGTGKAATPADVAEMHKAIRARVGGDVRILYGGSVKASNAAELFAIPDVDGALVGGASLTAKDFLPIIAAAEFRAVERYRLHG